MAIVESVEQFLHERAQRPRVVALGEPTHGMEIFPSLRNDLLRRLVDREECRCVTLESDCLAGQLVDDYVHGGDGDLDQVMADGFSHGFGASQANRAMVEWLRKHNLTHAGQVRFAGFDAPMETSGAQSPREPLRLLHTFLTAQGTDVPHPWSRIEALLGDDDRWSNPAVIMDPSQSIGDSAEARELRAIADDLAWLLTVETPRFTTDSAEAELGARTAAGLLAYHATLARTELRERFAHAMGLRDAMMAANLEALAARDPLLVFAHNQHVRRGPARWGLNGMNGWWNPAGAHLARRLGPDYVVIATAIGSAPALGLDAPPANTVEGVLAAGGPAPRLVPTGELTKEIAAAGVDLTTRTTPNFRYIPLDHDLLDGFDAVLFLPHVE